MNKSKNGKVPAYVVILGSNTIKAYVAAPKEFVPMGIIQVGMEYGLLCVTAEGTFVRVNGSIIKNLSQAQVQLAITKAVSKGRGASGQNPGVEAALASIAPAAPSVVVRRRRSIDPSIVAMHQRPPMTRPAGAVMHMARAPAVRGVLELC
jgi:hypothetical protein